MLICEEEDEIEAVICIKQTLFSGFVQYGCGLLMLICEKDEIEAVICIK